jgi:hypothetical protein
LQLINAVGGGKIYAFVTKPAREQKDAFDDEFPLQLFWGVYGTTPVLVPQLGLKTDLYYLGFKNDQAIFAAGVGDEERHTLGTRLFGNASGFDYDIEPVIQFGHFGSQDLLAWTFASSIGYRFEDAPARPRLGVMFDVASGDRSRRHSSSAPFDTSPTGQLHWMRWLLMACRVRLSCSSGASGFD